MLSDIEIFRHVFAAIPEEMGVTLERTGYSPNIKERRDFSCALFDAGGLLVAEAAHIPVHLAALPMLLARLLPVVSWEAGDVVACNDPFAGGTHLPDLTLVSPVFAPGEGAPVAFVANRAHHADIGGMAPGSMPASTELYQEGLIIPPVKLVDAGRLNEGIMDLIARNVRTPEERRGDLSAQIAANQTGVRRYLEVVERYGLAEMRARARMLQEYTERAVRAEIAAFPDGVYPFQDVLDDDGISDAPVPIRVAVTVAGDTLTFDFTGSAAQQRGPVNAPEAVTAAAVHYCVRCLLDEDVPVNAGQFAPVRIIAPEGSVVNPRFPAAVAAGNVETSQRLVDVLFGALAPCLPERVPAASAGTMNNLLIGGFDPVRGGPFTYYETLGGGAGAGPQGPGASGIQTHMTNTRNTPIEALEYHYPLRVRELALREGSGGAGRHRGGEGIRRQVELLAPATVTLLTERRRSRPYGLAGGEAGAPGRNTLTLDGQEQVLPGKTTLSCPAGALLTVESPGGGGWGRPDDLSADFAD